MKPLRFVPSSRLAAGLLWFTSIGLPVHHAGAGELSPAAQLEHDLISGTRDDNLKKIRQPVVDLDTKYKAALEKRRVEAQDAGKLDLVEQIDGAIKSFADGTPPAGESTDPELAKLGKVYIEQRAKLEASSKPALVEAWTFHRRKLEALVTRLTKEGKIEDAKAVRDEAASIDDTIAKLSGKQVIKSARDLILSTKWEVKPQGERPWTVKFRENGTASRGDETAVVWKWKIEDEKVLWCHWISSGWIKFEIPDLSASKFEGVSKGGEKWSMSPAN
ncbi:hypothetical protein OKA05_23350 [Luteolibacter arcticus]|uniref:Uncharacterized protein n=1 Tax=Luteolibacter arcticus TaxID=1581411 RepID=A0ABT3GPS9_9BACT|nr:hypothetical protein [Luteolibacter arcticus]MCW1925514.1 hypothetical protein [Luteolibacter arcticus]